MTEDLFAKRSSPVRGWTKVAKVGPPRARGHIYYPPAVLSLASLTASKSLIPYSLTHTFASAYKLLEVRFSPIGQVQSKVGKPKSIGT